MRMGAGGSVTEEVTTHPGSGRNTFQEERSGKITQEEKNRKRSTEALENTAAGDVWRAGLEGGLRAR